MALRMADDKRPVIPIANSDSGRHPSRPNLPDEGHLLPTQQSAANEDSDDDIRNITHPFDWAATFNEESQRAPEQPLQSTVIVKGKHETRDVMTVMWFLRLNSVPYKHVDQNPPPNVKVQVTLPPLKDQEILNDPTLITLSTKLNLMRIAKPVADSDDGKYECDVAVVGGGPAGLSAAVNLVALYGKSPLIIEQFAPGGEAATATNTITNYLSFPDGIQAAELAARWKKHADNLNIDWLPDYRVTDVVHDTVGNPSYPFTLTVAQNNYDRDSVAILDQQVAAKQVTTKQVAAKKILLACGINISKQGGKNEGKYAGHGVYYSTLTGDAALYSGNSKPVVIIGGGDTAGSAALMFARANIKTIMIIRSTLETDMLVVNYNQIEKYASLIDVREKTEVIAYYGNSDGYLDKLVIGPTGTKDEHDSKAISMDVAAAYVLIGAKGLDKTIQTWLEKLSVQFNINGVKTDSPTGTGKAPRFNMTNVDGVFVAGDARAGCVRRISEAVGDGGSASLGIYNDFNHKP